MSELEKYKDLHNVAKGRVNKANEVIDLLIKDKKALTLVLKEERIILAASTKREATLMGAIRAHKEGIDSAKLFKFRGDIVLHAMLGEVGA